jgi:hypothetical protein
VFFLSPSLRKALELVEAKASCRPMRWFEDLYLKHFLRRPETQYFSWEIAVPVRRLTVLLLKTRLAFDAAGKSVVWPEKVFTCWIYVNAESEMRFVKAVFQIVLKDRQGSMIYDFESGGLHICGTRNVSCAIPPSRRSWWLGTK